MRRTISGTRDSRKERVSNRSCILGAVSCWRPPIRTRSIVTKRRLKRENAHFRQSKGKIAYFISKLKRVGWNSPRVMNLQRAPNDSSRPRRSARHVQLVLRRCHLQKFRQFAAPSTIVTSARNAATIHTSPCKMIETQLPRAEKFRLNAANCEQLAERATDALAKQTLRNLVLQWQRLADLAERLEMGAWYWNWGRNVRFWPIADRRQRALRPWSSPGAPHACQQLINRYWQSVLCRSA